jgi:hypothetical protein
VVSTATQAAGGQGGQTGGNTTSGGDGGVGSLVVANAQLSGWLGGLVCPGLVDGAQIGVAGGAGTKGGGRDNPGTSVSILATSWTCGGTGGGGRDTANQAGGSITGAGPLPSLNGVAAAKGSDGLWFEPGSSYGGWIGYGGIGGGSTTGTGFAGGIGAPGCGGGGGGAGTSAGGAGGRGGPGYAVFVCW